MTVSRNAVVLGLALAILGGALAMLRACSHVSLDEPRAVGISELVAPTAVDRDGPLAPQEVSLRSSEAELVSVVTPAQEAPVVTEEEEKRRAFAVLLDQFDGKELEKPYWPGFSKQQLVPIVVMSSVAAVMDAQGTSTLVPQGHRSEERRVGKG